MSAEARRGYIQGDPPQGVETLDRWERSRGPHPAFAEWRDILTSRSTDEVIALLLNDSDEAARLRQSSPFTGILSSEERIAIFHHDETL